MSAGDQPFRLVLTFELTEAETRTIASRAGFRAAVGGLAFGRRLAPVVVFLAALALAAGLGVAGVIPRRAAEAAILGLVIVFALSRSAANHLVRRAFKAQRRRAEALGRSGAIRAVADGRALTLDAAAPIGVWRYALCRDADIVDGVFYLWGADGEAAPIPTRVFPPGEAERLLAYVKSKMPGAP